MSAVARAPERSPVQEASEWLRRPREWFRRSLTTTPGRLRLASLLIALAATVFGVVATGAAVTRSDGANAVATQTEPQLFESEGLYASLSDADATAATTFLTGGVEPVASRQRYLADVHSASAQLATLAQQAGGSSQASAAVHTIATQFPIYTGLVDTARADNRQGLPVGAAYLREASSLMRTQILPAAGQLYAVSARRLNGDYGSGTSLVALIAFVVCAVALLVLLVLTQRYVTERTNRILNVPMVAATVLLVVLGIWVVVGFTAEQSALARAQRDGSDSVAVLSAGRILALRAQADESLALIARGQGQQDVADSNAALARLGASSGGGLLGDAATIASRTGSRQAIDGLSSGLAGYTAVHRRVVALESTGHFDQAVQLAVGSSAKEVGQSDALDAGFRQQIAAAQTRFASAASDATGALSGLTIAIPLFAVAAALLALYGLQLRIKEYR